MLLTLGRGLSPASSARASLADLLWTIEGDSTAVEAGPAPQYTVNYSSYALQPDETASVTLALADVDTQPADFLSTLSSRLAAAAAAATGITWTQIDAWSGILTFSDGGDTSLTFDLPLVEELGEDAEDFTLAISAPSHGALGASNSVTTTISADPTGVMDDYLTNAEGIYGFEPLTVFPWGTVDGVANPLTRIRRASDNAEKTFNAGDIGTVTTWLAGAAGYVTKMYSQSGSGNHAVQTTASRQPQYAASHADNAKPYAIFDGVNDCFLSANAPTPSANWTIYSRQLSRGAAGSAASSGVTIGLSGSGGSDHYSPNGFLHLARPAAISAERRQGSDWFAIVDYHTANNAFFSAAFNFGGGTAEGFYDGVSYATDLYDELSSLAPYAISIGVNTNSAGGLSSAYPDMDWQGGFVLREKVPGADLTALNTDFAALFA